MSKVRVRELHAGEAAVLDAVFEQMSPASRASRYHQPIRRLAPTVRAALTDVDGQRHIAIVAEVGRGRSARPIGIARAVATGPGRGEMAVEVVDAWHGRGVAGRLVSRLRDLATARGYAELVAEVLWDNAAMLAVLRRAFPVRRTRRDGGVLLVTCVLDPRAAGDPLGDFGRSLTVRDLTAPVAA